ncbi:hypothetical protein NQ318_012336 [Aromia moschata]|uniref:Uncharacterized protein n=1 Tax=Aromia moschata TaxID=1265417 RepID=A0AAV8XME9_9CUCU|nr:hypothetical protein NQ318_012336 [Aromia moschata]
MAVDLLKLLLPTLVNGTKEKNVYVKANSEIALIAVLRLKDGDAMFQFPAPNIFWADFKRPGGSIEYKIRHPDEFQIFPVRFNRKCSIVPMEQLPRLYQGKLKIKRKSLNTSNP